MSKISQWTNFRKLIRAVTIAGCLALFGQTAAFAASTYDFSSLGAASDGFKPQGNRFLVSSSFINDPSHLTAIYYTSGASTVTGITIKADGVNLRSFDLNDMGFIVDPGPDNITSLKITATRSIGDPVSVTVAPGDSSTFKLSDLANLSNFTNVTQLQFDITMNKVLNLDFATITIGNEVHLPPAIATAFGAADIPLDGTTSLTFTVENPNTTATLSSIAFSDILPAGLVVAPVPNLSSNCGGTITAPAGSSAVTLAGADLAPAASCTVSVAVQGTTAGQKNNSVTVTSANGGTGNSASATVNVATAADLAIANAAPTIAVPQTPLTYNITLTNNGPNDAQNVSISDTLPPNTLFTSISMGGGSGWNISTPAVGGTGTIICTKSAVASGESAIFLVSVQIGAGAANGNSIANTVTATAQTADPNPTNNNAVASSTVAYPVRAGLSGYSYYPTLTAACADVSSPNTIDVWGIEFPESLTFNQGKTITIRGGNDASFQNNGTVTTINSPLLVVSGKLISERIAVR